MRHVRDKKLGFRFAAALLTLGLAGVFCFALVSGSTDNDPGGFEPPNPDYLRWLHRHQLDPEMTPLTYDGYALGDIPSTVDPYLYDTGEEMDQAEINGLPAKYDLRTKSKLPPVRDQGSCGSCWAFAAYGALESSMLPGASWNFSEQHMIKKHGFKYAPCAGGNLSMAMAYMTRWAGPVNESDMPYSYMEPDGMELDGAAAVKKHVQNVVYIPVRTSNTDNNKLKKAVKTYGAVSTSMYWDSSCYNSATNAYYNSNIADGGHAVCIVGWDNNYDKSNFVQIPPRNGAFIVRNSWGDSWGENGYFYVSYCDQYFARRFYGAAFKQPEATTNYSRAYAYDISGWTHGYGWSSQNYAWCANIFTAKGNDSIQAVSFYARGTTNKYVLYVYRGVTAGDPRSGTLVTQKSGKFTNPGYYTVKLKQNVAVSNGQKFSVVLKLTTIGSNYPLPCEVRTAGYTKPKNSKGAKGQGYISSNGSYWYDLFVEAGNASVCLKAFAK